MKSLHIACCLGIFLQLNPNIAVAQIRADNTVGSQLIQNALTNGDRVDGGMVRGSNLFHSFSEFNINAGRGVYFTNPDNITNIFTRVTGNNPSNINGTLGVLGNSNLFFMNPNGIIFGTDAALDIKGSFLGTTANSIHFADGMQFSSTNSQPASLLTVSVPVGLGFGSNTGGISNHANPGLQVMPGQTIALIGGNISMLGGQVIAPQGNIELGSVANNSFVGLTQADKFWSLNYQNNQNFQDINLTEVTLIDASGSGGGNITIYGNNIRVDGISYISSNTNNSDIGGVINLNASSSIQLTNSSSIYGDVLAEATGRGVNININTPKLSVLGASDIGVYSSGIGDAGDLNIKATDIEVAGHSVDKDYWSSLYNTAWKGQGNGGNLTIESQRISLRDGAVIGASTWSRGNAGNVYIKASEFIEVFGNTNNINYPTAIRAEVKPGSTGNGGNILIETPLLFVSNQGLVSVSSTGNGNAGNLKINTNNLKLDTNGSISATVNNGNRGNIVIDTNIMTMRRDSNITTNASENSNGGNISINADAIVQLENSDITANALTGRGGNININSQSIFNSLDSQITATGSVDGEVQITTPDIKQENSLEHQSSNFLTTKTFVANSCLHLSNSQQGRFVVTGNGGIAEAPSNQNLDYSLLLITPVITSASSQIIVPSQQQLSAWKIGSPINEATELIKTKDGRLILLNDNNGRYVSSENLTCQSTEF
ncbi:MAG: filamentous hemagglutinin N-terminal domain-containing protein [Scytonematopsis contorta HA4267-MV1]|jgi:filamentous hemagglutinin family protein|nr:filamentous hemagglutinin N-terminal domain-containing protein [Scytonematopsis contorta HA4267-MV1]